MSMKTNRFYSQGKKKFKRIAIALLLKSLDIGLNRTSYRRISRLLVFLSPQPDPLRQDLSQAVALARLVDSVAAHPKLQASCLRRTLATWWLLRWFRIPSDVRVGINRTTGHAWLEHHGLVINDRPDIVKSYPIVYSDELTPEKMAKLV